MFKFIVLKDPSKKSKISLREDFKLLFGDSRVQTFALYLHEDILIQVFFISLTLYVDKDLLFYLRESIFWHFAPKSVRKTISK